MDDYDAFLPILKEKFQKGEKMTSITQVFNLFMDMVQGKYNMINFVFVMDCK